MNKNTKLTINHRFNSIFQPLTESESKDLEFLLQRDGCMYPIIVWNNQIIDGRNRYAICNRLNITYSVVEKEFDSEDSAELWIRQFGMGRRSLNEYVRISNEKAIAQLSLKLNGKANIVQRNKNSTLSTVDKVEIIPHNTRKEIAKAAKVSTGKIAEFDVVEKHADEETKQKLAQGLVSIHGIYSDIKSVEKTKKLEAKKIEIAQTSKNEISNNKPIVKNIDCIEFLNSYKDNEIDALITDPPYSTDVDDIQSFVNNWLPLALSKVKSDGRCYICTGAYPIEIQAYLNIFLKQDKFIVDAPLIWTYRNTLGVTPKDKYALNYQMIWHLHSSTTPSLDTSITNEMFSVQDINAPDGRQGDRFHSWQKPDELANRFIRHGTQDNDLVVDPFCCTGAFLIAAAKSNRKAQGCDINMDNLNIAIERGCQLN